MKTKPTVVCLCGSTRFMEAFQQANLAETIAGRIVLSIGCNTKCDADLIALGELTPDAKEQLDELHKRKIDLADEVLILNVGGYVGQSTRSELRYAREHGKRVRWLEEQMALEDDWPPIDVTQRLTPPDATPTPDAGEDGELLALTQDEVFDALGLAMEKIESAGASVPLTDAVIIVGDVRASLGNKWNKADKYRAAMVRTALKAAGAKEGKYTRAVRLIMDDNAFKEPSAGAEGGNKP